MIGCFLLWFFLLWGQMGNPTKMSQWLFDAYEKKQKISRSIKSKKIVIVAGSNALFGVDSQMLGEAFGLPVLNDSVNAGIELPGILFMAQKVINRGDMVIMPLEYGLFSYNGDASVQMIDFILSRRTELLSRLTIEEQFYLYWHVTLERIYTGYFDHSESKITKGIYGVHHIDANGDQTHTELPRQTKQMRSELKTHIDQPVKYSESFDPNAPGWHYLNYFVEWCRERNVEVVFMPAALMQDKSYVEIPEERWFFTHLPQEIQSRGWHYTGNPYDYMYENECYFNTRYHLIDKCRKIRTERMIKDLRESHILSP